MVMAPALLIPFAEAAGLTIAGLGAIEIGKKVQDFVDNNPEKSNKILTSIKESALMTLPGSMGLNTLFKKKAKPVEEEIEISVEEKDPKDLTKKEKAEIMKETAKSSSNKSRDMKKAFEDVIKPGKEEDEFLEGEERYDGGLEEVGKAKGYDYRDFIPFRKKYNLGGLTTQGQRLSDSMSSYGFNEMEIAQALDEQQLYPESMTLGLQQEAVVPPRVQPILPINQGDSSGITTNINRSNPNFDYEFAALGNLANPNNVALTEEEQKTLNFQKGKDGLMSFAKGLGYAINPLGFFAKKGYDLYKNKVRDAQYREEERLRMEEFQKQKAAALAFEEEKLANTAFQNAMANPTAFYASLNDGAGATSTASSRSEAGTDDTPGTPFANGGLATMFVRRG